MTESHPAWLKRMQNGSIGEARARSFLIDRFWILERSVDIEGADFIIQRRITTNSLFDLKPPRLGLVQAKFFQDGKTDIYVHSEYVTDETGAPHLEFNLIASTGYEDNCRLYVLSADEIIKNFSMMPEGTENYGKYKIQGKVLLEDRFKVASPRLSLQRMEAALNLADLTKNHNFMLPFVSTGKPIEDAIAPIYSDKIDNAYCSDIPRTFFSIKKQAQKYLGEINEAKDLLEQIITSTDPQIALKAAEEFDFMLTPSGHLSLKQIHDPDFENDVKEHLRKASYLKENGLLDHYILFRENAERDISNYICVDDKWKNYMCQLTLKLDKSLNIKEFMLAKLVTEESLPSHGKIKIVSADRAQLVLNLFFAPAACRWSFNDTYQKNPTWEQIAISNSRVWVSTVLYAIFSWVELEFCAIDALRQKLQQDGGG